MAGIPSEAFPGFAEGGQVAVVASHRNWKCWYFMHHGLSGSVGEMEEM